MEVILKFIARCRKCESEFENYLIGNCELCIDCNYTDTCETSIKKLCQNVNCKKCFYKSFLSCKKSKFWDYTKNNCNPREVLKYSNKVYIFNCNCGHDFKSILYSITRGNWCPYCSKPCHSLCKDENCNQCFNNSFSSHEKSKYWDYEKNKYKPRELTKNTNKKFWFKCDVCYHGFEIGLGNVNNNQWCFYCSSAPKLCIDEKCEYCFNNSFLSHEKSKYWDYERNKINPRNIFKSSSKSYWFNCVCGHDFESVLTSINNGNWCTYCSHKKLCDNKDCNSCFNNSFLSSEKSKYWDYEKNKYNPRQVCKGSRKKVWFNCDCGHNFENKLCNINNGNWCSYCSTPPHKLCKDEKCNHCFNNSFLSVEKSKYWDYQKNKYNPRQVFKSSGEKYWFKCKKNHSFECALTNVTKGQWCKHCKYKTESIIFDFLKSKKYKFFAEQKFDWCKNIETNKHFPFDFYIPRLKIILEIDGAQHFRQISNWTSPEDTQKRDIYKENLCLENGLSVIRINQEDIFYNRTDWKNHLKNNLIKYSCPTIIYLCSKNNYSGRN